MITLVVDGISYQYPQVDDEDWGNQATLWASSVSDVLAQLRHPTLPVATTGQVRLGNGDVFAWRNFGNTDNVKLYVDVDDKLYIKIGANPAIDLTAAAGGNVTGPGTSTDNALTRFDGTTGQIIQNSIGILSDAGALSGLLSVDATTVKQGGVALTDLFIDIIGSSTDNAIARWDSTTGKQIQNSVGVLDDSGNLSGIGSLAMSGDLTVNGSATLGDAAGDVLTINATPTAASANKIIAAYTRTTGTTVGIGGVGISAAGSRTVTSSAFEDVTSVAVTITTGGRPVRVSAQGVSFGVGKQGGASVAGISASFRFTRDGTGLNSCQVNYDYPTTTTTLYEVDVPGTMEFVDVVAAGTYTYKLQAANNSASSIAFVSSVKLIVYEL